MNRYRKKPVVIEAIQWDGSSDQAVQIMDWINSPAAGYVAIEGPAGTSGASGAHIKIPTLEGTMRAGPGDWVIRGVKGEFYPCKNEIFLVTYEPVESATT